MPFMFEPATCDSLLQVSKGYPFRFQALVYGCTHFCNNAMSKVRGIMIHDREHSRLYSYSALHGNCERATIRNAASCNCPNLVGTKRVIWSMWMRIYNISTGHMWPKEVSKQKYDKLEWVTFCFPKSEKKVYSFNWCYWQQTLKPTVVNIACVHGCWLLIKRFKAWMSWLSNWVDSSTCGQVEVFLPC